LIIFEFGGGAGRRVGVLDALSYSDGLGQLNNIGWTMQGYGLQGYNLYTCAFSKSKTCVEGSDVWSSLHIRPVAITHFLGPDHHVRLILHGSWVGKNILYGPMGCNVYTGVVVIAKGYLTRSGEIMITELRRYVIQGFVNKSERTKRKVEGQPTNLAQRIREIGKMWTRSAGIRDTGTLVHPSPPSKHIFSVPQCTWLTFDV